MRTVYVDLPVLVVGWRNVEAALPVVHTNEFGDAVRGWLLRLGYVVEGKASKVTLRMSTDPAVLRHWERHTTLIVLIPKIGYLISKGEEWYNTLLVVAQREGGQVVDMDEERETHFLLRFRRYMTSQAVDHNFPRIDPVLLCLHVKAGEPKEEPDNPGSSRLPVEILWKIAREASLQTWLTAITGRGLMRRVIHHVLRERCVAKIYEGYEENALKVPLYLRCSSAMTILTGSTIYSFYTPVSEDGIVLVDRLSSSPYPGDGNIRASVDGNLLTKECGMYCPRRPRAISSMLGVDQSEWGGLDLRQTRCACEQYFFAAPITWILSRWGRCLNMHCGFYNSIDDNASPLPTPAKDLRQLAMDAERLIIHIPLMRLLATADGVLHCRVGLKITSTGSTYKNPVGETWHVNYVGRILPTWKGSRHCAVGDQQQLPIPKRQAVRDLLVLGPPGEEVPLLNALYARQLLNLDDLISSERMRHDVALVPEWSDTTPETAIHSLHVRLPPKYARMGFQERCRTPQDAAMVGLEYDPRWLSDYREEDFEPHEKRLVQLPIYDENRRLVRPWDQYHTLRPGTIVLVTAKMKVYRKEGNLAWSFFMKYMQVLVPAAALEEQWIQDFPSTS
ncbi:hypothetical protein EYR36_002306 [Pleurotus pulmonarius]|nr:hypothetical protein EYR36_002306 [Pleurotus pulmonarius]